MIRRSDLSDRAIALLGAAAAAAVAAYYAAAYPLLPSAWRTPGSRELYLSGVAGAALLLVPMIFALAKRTGRGGSPPAWFVAHVVASVTGTVLIAIHVGGSLGKPPALLFATLLVLVALGGWARTRGSRHLAGTFASRQTAFSPNTDEARRLFAHIIVRKHALLARLDPVAREALFSVTLRHWLRSPVLSWRYAALAREERRLLGTGGWAPTAQTLARRLHILLAYLFVAGLIAHVVIVTFFADYAARGGPVTWWHVSR